MDRALAERHRLAQAAVSGRTQAALSAVWGRYLRPADLDGSFPAYSRAATAVVGAGRGLSSSVAADYYRQARAAAGLDPAGAVQPVAEALNAAQVETVLRVTGPVEIKRRVAEGQPIGEASRQALALTLGDAARLTLNAGRETTLDAARRDPDATGWARISDGAPCAFCAMLVSRGPVYRSEASADFRSHGKCGCTAGLIFDGDGWTPEARALRDLWDSQGGDLASFRSAYRGALKDPSSPVSKAIAAKLAPVAPAYVQEVRAIAERLPDRASLGVRTETVDAAATARQAALDAAAKAAGGTPDELRALLGRANAHLDGIRGLLDDFDRLGLDGYASAARFPPDVKARLSDLGFSTRRKPGNIYRDLVASLSAQRQAIPGIEVRLRNVEAQWRSIQAYKYPGGTTTRRLDDLLPDGSLGPTTAKALDDVLEAGRLLDEEIYRRLDARDALLYERADDARAAFERAYRAHLDADYWDETADAIRRREAGKAEVERLRAAMRAAEDAVDTALNSRAADLSRVAREVLAEVRPLGGKGSSYVVGAAEKGAAQVSAESLVARMRMAESRYPSDWLERVRTEYPEVELVASPRGYNQRGTRIALDSQPRSHGGADFDPIATHELGHSMERAVPGLRGMEWAFHYRRSAVLAEDGSLGLPPAFDLYGGDIGMGTELAHRDAWALEYTGKTYRQYYPDAPGADVAWEVFTTGVESLLDTSPYFQRRVTAGGDDVEFRRFILGVLSVL